MPVDRTPRPVPIDPRGIIIADGLEVWPVTITDDIYAMVPTFPTSALGQGIAFHFHAAGLPPFTYLLPADRIDADLGPAVAEMCAMALDPANPTLADAAAKAHEANLRAGYLPGGPTICCPGCNARLFGDVAVRGACLTCYPTLPDDLAQPHLEGGADGPR